MTTGGYDIIPRRFVSGGVCAETLVALLSRKQNPHLRRSL